MHNRDSASSRRTRRKCRGSASIMTRASLGGSIAKRQCKACLSALEAMMNYLVLSTRCHARICICDQRSPIERRREGKINNPASPSKIAEVCISILYSICCAIIGSAVRPGVAELKSLRFSIPAQTNNTARLYFHTLVELPDVGSKKSTLPPWTFGPMMTTVIIYFILRVMFSTTKSGCKNTPGCSIPLARSTALGHWRRHASLLREKLREQSS